MNKSSQHRCKTLSPIPVPMNSVLLFVIQLYIKTDVGLRVLIETKLKSFLSTLLAQKSISEVQKIC